MSRYFLQVAYKGTHYSGFQIQQNTEDTIQYQVEKALKTLLKTPVSLTGSSRTDAGVHALQNFFHFDLPTAFNTTWLYKLNAILPTDIVIKKVTEVAEEAHCRFDALTRTYHYYIYRQKNPFLEDRAYYFPYTINVDLMNEAAAILMEYTDFTSFSKRNTQVKTFNVSLMESIWIQEEDCIYYRVKGNRFLRGMVRGLTATMLQIGREKINTAGLHNILQAKDCTKANFAVPAHGLFLTEVKFPFAI